MADTTAFFEECLNQLRRGDVHVRDAIISRVSERMIVLADRMLRRSPRLARWVEKEDLGQQATMRLHRSLANLAPATPQELLNLAAIHIRRELCDLARHHLGPRSYAANHDSRARQKLFSGGIQTAQGASDSDSDAHALAGWTEFHAFVETLPEHEKNVFCLLWYDGLNQSEAANVLGISERQLRRHWQSARLMIRNKFGDSGRFW